MFIWFSFQVYAALVWKSMGSPSKFNFSGNQFSETYFFHVKFLQNLKDTVPRKFHHMMADIYETVQWVLLQSCVLHVDLDPQAFEVCWWHRAYCGARCSPQPAWPWWDGWWLARIICGIDIAVDILIAWSHPSTHPLNSCYILPIRYPDLIKCIIFILVIHDCNPNTSLILNGTNHNLSSILRQ